TSRLVHTPPGSRRPGIGGTTASEPVASTTCRAVWRTPSTSTTPGPGCRTYPAGHGPARSALRAISVVICSVWAGGREQAGDAAAERERGADPQCGAERGAERQGGGVRSPPCEHGHGQRDAERAAELAQHRESAGGLAEVLRDDVAQHRALRRHRRGRQ